MSYGALSFYHNRFVRARVTKFAYGIFCDLPFDPIDLDHQQRLHKTSIKACGRMAVRDFFAVILPKVSSISFMFARC